MKQGWELKKMGEVLSIERGGSPRPIEKYMTNSPDGINWIKISDATASDKYIYETKEKITKDGLHKTRVVNEGDFILSNSMSFGRPYIMKTTGCIHDGWLVLKQNGKKIFETEFLYYLLSSPFVFQQFNSKAAGSTVRNLNIALVSSVDVPIPPLPEQQNIVAILDEAFAAIAKAKDNAEQNLKNAKELFESYLDDLFTKLFQEREKKIVSDVAKVTGGYSFKSTDFRKEGKYQVIRMGNVRPGIIRENESPVFLDELDEKALTKALLQLNDVIITQTGTKKKRDYGFTVIIEKGNYLLNQRIASIRFSEKYLPKFFLYFSWTNLFKDQYFENETGTVGQGNVGISAVTDAEIPFIPVKEQKQIIDRIDELRIETQKLEAIYQKKINDLEELKKSVLQKAFSGELKTETALA
jgi:type I restriction enzyme S subunit